MVRKCYSLRCGDQRWIVCRIFFFFFQAEDGIRDVAVTGVQTCALPICSSTSPVESASAGTRFCGLIARNSSLHCQIGRAHVELQSRLHLVCRLLLEKKKKTTCPHA